MWKKRACVALIATERIIQNQRAVLKYGNSEAKAKKRLDKKSLENRQTEKSHRRSKAFLEMYVTDYVIEWWKLLTGPATKSIFILVACTPGDQSLWRRRSNGQEL